MSRTKERFESIDDFLRTIRDGSFAPRTVVIHYSVNRTERITRENIIDAAWINGKAIRPASVVAAASPYTTIIRTGEIVTPQTHYVLSVNGKTWTAPQVSVRAVAARDIEDNKFFATVEPIGKPRERTIGRDEREALRDSDYFLSLVRNVYPKYLAN